MRTDAQSLRHVCDGLFTDVSTGQQVLTRMEIHHNESESWTVLVIGNGEPHRALLLPEQYVWWRDTLFPSPPIQGTPAPSPSSIVNIDGSPRNRLLDRWRRRWIDPEASAAD